MTSREGTPGLPEWLPLIPDQLGTNGKGKAGPPSLPAAHAEVSIFQPRPEGQRSAARSGTGDGAQPTHASQGPIAAFWAVPAPPWHAESNGLSSAVMLAPFLEKARFQFTALLRNSSVFLPNLKRRLPRHSKFSDKPTVSALCISAKALPY